MKLTPVPFKHVPTLLELKEGFPGIKALFFDMDGTVFDTESHHADAMLMIGAKYGIKPPHSTEIVRELMIGKADHLVFDIIKDWEGVPKGWTAREFIDEKNRNLINILKRTNPAEYFSPDVLKLLQEARADGLYLALITSSEKTITSELLKIENLHEFFEFILTRDDCLKHKPDPWPYIRALEISGMDKTEVIIFEDSDVGLSAAMDAGTHVAKVEWFS